jgi:cytoskeletal protein CcmA (bactofilin family)
MKKFLVAAAVLTLSIPALAAFHWGGRKQLQKGDITVAKGETFKGDIATDGSVDVEGTVTGDVAAFGGGVVIAGEALGDVASFGGPVKVSGRVKGDVASFGGPVVVEGSVGGEVAATGGDLTLGGGSMVGGDVALMGGKLAKSDSARIGGSVTSFDAGLLRRLAPVMRRWGKSAIVNGDQNTVKLDWRNDEESEESGASKAAKFAGFLIFNACIGALIAALAAFFPKHVATVAEAAKADFWGSAGVGVLMMLCFIPGIILLCVSILGIPLIPLGLMASFAAVVLALAAASRLAAERLFEALKKPAPSTTLAALAGYGALIGLMAVGKLMRLTGGIGSFAGGTLVLAGFMILTGAIVVGLGAVWRTRMGGRAA